MTMYIYKSSKNCKNFNSNFPFGKFGFTINNYYNYCLYSVDVGIRIPFLTNCNYYCYAQRLLYCRVIFHCQYTHLSSSTKGMRYILLYVTSSILESMKTIVCEKINCPCIFSLLLLAGILASYLYEYTIFIFDSKNILLEQ